VISFGVNEREGLAGGVNEAMEVATRGRGEGPQLEGDGAGEGVPFGGVLGLDLTRWLWVRRTTRRSATMNGWHGRDVESGWGAQMMTTGAKAS